MTYALWLLTTAFLTFAANGAFSGPDAAAVFSEEPARLTRSLLRLVPVVVVVLGPLFVLVVKLAGPVGLALLMLTTVLLASESLRRRRQATAVLRAARRHGAPFLSWLASGRKGAGLALLDARCAVADEREEWLCLEAPRH